MPAKLLSKLKALGKSGDEDGLVKANLTGSTLPPEFKDRQRSSLHTPSDQQYNSAEVAGIASIHPEYLETPTLTLEPLPDKNDAPMEGRSSFFGSLGGRSSGGGERRGSDGGERVPSHGEASEGRRSLSGGRADGGSMADSLGNRDSSVHKDIHNLAEHYKGRSRRLAAARELENASNPKEKAAIILDHQLNDIDSI